MHVGWFFVPWPAARSWLSCLSGQIDLAAPLDPTLYASDASEAKGFGLTLPGPSGARLPKRQVTTGCSQMRKPLWQSLTPEHFALRAVQPPSCASPQRPLAYVFDFIEVYSGSARVAAALGRKGFGIGASIDVAESPAFNMEWLRTLEWLIHLLQRKRLRSFLVAPPPCATYSPAGHPACRSSEL